MSGTNTPPSDAAAIPGGVTPVGVTIAFKRKQDGLLLPKQPLAKQQQEPLTTPVESSSSSPPSSPTSSSKTKKSSSLKVFMDGATLYAACLVLPTLAGILLRAYDAWYHEEALELHPLHSNEFDDSWSTYARETAAYYVCPMGPVSPDSWLYTLGLCSTESPSSLAPQVLSPDAYWTDFGLVALCACTLAAIRIALVQIHVQPYHNATKLQALVRCRSIHLLSKEYRESMTPRSGTPILRKKQLNLESLDKDPSLLLPPLHSGATSLPQEPTTLQPEPEQDLGLGLDDSDRGPLDSQQDWVQLKDTGEDENAVDDKELSRLTLSPEKEPIYKDDSPDSAAVAPAEPARPATPPPLKSSSSSSSSSDRLYAAPRYATAMFRLLYSTAASLLAWWLFARANFWPWYVGGHGSTAQCWDLSGGLSVGMDSDYDNSNAVLRRYFLWQASYHVHSGAFHLLSMVLLLLHQQRSSKATSSPQQQSATGAASPSLATPQPRFVQVKSSFSAYFGSLSQHILAVALIATAYVFSSLRRLGAIGMFAFDVSSWFLHLLQICINAPDESKWKRPVVVRRIRNWLVIPSFTYMRFFVWPALWYSLASESHVWLTQLENMLVPGSALAMQCIFHVCMGLLMAFSIVYFGRLLHHPHLNRILRNGNK